MEIINLEGQLVTDSRDVAEMIEMEHWKLLRTLEGTKDGKSKGVISILTDNNIVVSEFFIPNSYKDTTGRTLPCYLLTRKGCDMIANKMTGEKGVLFTAAYVTRFEEMEQKLSQPINSLELALQAALKHEQEINGIKSDVDYLKGSMRIDSLQQQEIQQEAKKSVMHALGGKESNAYIKVSKKAFSAFWNEFKQYFKVPRYGDIPKVKQEEAIRFIRLWRPSTTLQMEIDNCNSQMSFIGNE